MQIRYLTGLLYGMLCTGIALADPASPEPLPNPLTLEQALALADDAHPDIELAKARLSMSQAQASAAEAQTGLEISGQLLPQYVQRTSPVLAFQNSDNQAHLLITKRLYDFGASEAQRDAANRLVASSSLD